MTLKPPSNSEGTALPPRQRPNMGDLAKDTTESDLWAFDSMETVSDTAAVEVPKPTQQILPIPRESDRVKVRQLKETVGTKFGGTMDRLVKPLPLEKPNLSAELSRPGSDFHDLDAWDEPVSVSTAVEEMAAPLETPPFKIAQSASIPVVEIPASPLPAPETVIPASLGSRLNLSKLERLGLVALVGLLCMAGAVIFFLTIYRLPSKPEIAKANAFPVQGVHLAVLSASSHWRAPQPTDTVRRGTQLLPVLNLNFSGGPAAIRVFFRNSEGMLVGDAVTRSTKSGSDLEVVATGGFDDVGLHAAYRNGRSIPWTIEVFEAPSENSAGPEFKKLFVMNISTVRR